LQFEVQFDLRGNWNYDINCQGGKAGSGGIAGVVASEEVIDEVVSISVTEDDFLDCWAGVIRRVVGANDSCIPNKLRGIFGIDHNTRDVRCQGGDEDSGGHISSLSDTERGRSRNEAFSRSTTSDGTRRNTGQGEETIAVSQRDAGDAGANDLHSSNS